MSFVLILESFEGILILFAPTSAIAKDKLVGAKKSRVLGVRSPLMKSARVLRTNAQQLTTKATCCFCDFPGTGTAGFCAEAERGDWVQVQQDLILIT